VNPLYPLYRFYAVTNVANDPVTLYWNFLNTIYNAQWTNMSHVMDGVAHLVVRAYDASGYQMTNTYQFRAGNTWETNANVWFSPPEWGEVGFALYSNCVPSAVELQLGVLEDRTLQRAESEPTAALQRQYLQGQAGHVQLFRQRVTIPNFDPSAYQ
jgi:hypothetical protein